MDVLTAKTGNYVIFSFRFKKGCQGTANPVGGGRTGGPRGGQGKPPRTRLPWAMGGPLYLSRWSSGASGSLGGTPGSGQDRGPAGGMGPPGEWAWGRGPKYSLLLLLGGANVPHIFVTF